MLRLLARLVLILIIGTATNGFGLPELLFWGAGWNCCCGLSKRLAGGIFPDVISLAEVAVGLGAQGAGALAKEWV